jgi:hypothetical protein
MVLWKKDWKYIKLNIKRSSILKRMLNLFIHFGSQTIGKIPAFSITIHFFYIHFLIPSIKALLKTRHRNLIDLKIRNSINEKERFNLFLSDIDTTLVIENETDSSLLIKDFLMLRHFFIMLDLPEIYTLDEYKIIEELKNRESWKLIELCWNIIKINWCYS